MPTEQDLARILPLASKARLARFAGPLSDAMSRFAIDANVRRAAAFVAQLAHESGEFRWMEEIWGPTAAQKRYEPPGALATRLGNTERGDGFRYKGRGPIQVTGRWNYRRYGELLHLDLVGRPELAATPTVGFAVAGLYWERNGLNALADRDDFEAITRRINGGLNGLADRRRFHARALEVFATRFPPAPPVAARRSAPPGDDGTDGEPGLERGAEAIRAEEAGAPAGLSVPSSRRPPSSPSR